MKLHPEIKPKKFNKNLKQKKTTTTQHDFWFDFGDETKITAMGIKGKNPLLELVHQIVTLALQMKKQGLNYFMWGLL